MTPSTRRVNKVIKILSQCLLWTTCNAYVSQSTNKSIDLLFDLWQWSICHLCFYPYGKHNKRSIKVIILNLQKTMLICTKLPRISITIRISNWWWRNTLKQREPKVNELYKKRIKASNRIFMFNTTNNLDINISNYPTEIPSQKQA